MSQSLSLGAISGDGADDFDDLTDEQVLDLFVSPEMALPEVCRRLLRMEQRFQVASVLLATVARLLADA